MLLVKVGGGDVDLEAIAADLATIEGPLVVLHGANRLRDDLAGRLGAPPTVVESISGYTSVLSDETAIDLLMAAYAGIRNKRLVEALRRAGVNALGLSGLDGGVVTGEQNRGIRVIRDGRKLLLRDQSGKPRGANVPLLRTLIDDGYVPVLTVPIAGEDGTALNTENDDVLTVLARALGATRVVSLMDEVGLLADRSDPATLVPDVQATELREWEERVSGRMRRKIRALGELFDGTPSGLIVHLADGRAERPVTRALAGAGTRVRSDDDASTSGDVATAGDVARDASPSEASAAGATGWLERNAAHELDVYGKRGITIVEAHGSTVTDDQGRSWLDCIGGNGALSLGHRHPRLQQALAAQLDRVWCVPGAFVSPARVEFLERLHAVLPPELSRTFLSNSGTEAVEAAIKFARQHTGRVELVAAERAFHGRTFGSLSLTAGAHYRAPFEPLLPGVRRIGFGDIEALDQAVDLEVAALVLEPVQGEGGVHPADPGFLRAARTLCDERGALLVFDEVQTGFGRTGRLFAFEHAGVVPDVLCLAKSVAAGLPLGATVVRDGIDPPQGTHGSTFGGNPLACAVGAASLDVIRDEGLVARAEAIGRAICAPLDAAPPRIVREIRRVGAMIGIDLRVRARPFLDALAERGVLALTAGRTVIRLLPPLVMTDDEAGRVGRILAEVLGADEVDGPS